MKSFDKKYVFKEIERIEFESFKKFGKSYFSYFFNCKSDNRPTLLTKIYGMYEIKVSNS